MIAGGASFAPRRWSLPASAIDARSMSAWTLTAADHRQQERQELGVGVRIRARDRAGSRPRRCHRPVVVLARAVDAGKRLLVDEQHQPVLQGELAHRRHDEHVVVGADRRRLVHRRHLELCRGDLVVARLGRDAEAPQLAVEIHHEGQDPLADRAEVLVLELLALGRRRAEQRAPGEQQVGPLLGEPAVDEEVLLLGTDVGEHARGRCRCRTSAGRAAPACRARPASAAAGSCSRAPRR